MGDKLLSGLSDNPQGHFEDIDFIKKNIQLLGGDCWDKIPLKKAASEVEIEGFMQSKKRDGFWGWKDPRTVLTIDQYYPYLDDPIIVALFRNPEKVGESLERRGNMSKEEGVKLAKAYNQRLIEFLQEKFL